MVTIAVEDTGIGMYEAALDRAGGNAELLARLARSFCRSLPSSRRSVAQALAARHGRDLNFAAHALVGPLGMFSANGAMAAARAVERLAHEEDWSATTEAVTTLEAELDALQPALAARFCDSFCAADA